MAQGRSVRALLQLSKFSIRIEQLSKRHPFVQRIGAMRQLGGDAIRFRPEVDGF